jgi:hypothetical protein
MNNDQDCALRKLHQLLTLAIASGALSSTASEVLESAINASGESLGMLDFFYILRQASVEARKTTIPVNVKDYIPAIDNLGSFVLSHDACRTQWQDYKSHVISCNSMVVIDALANYYSQEHPSRTLEKEYSTAFWTS